MLHYILAQVSIQLIFKTGNVFPLLPCFIASTLGSLNNSLVSAPIFSLLRWLVLNPVFPWGVWAIFLCVPRNLSFIPVCIPQTVFRIWCVSSISWGVAGWQQPEIGASTRVGTFVAFAVAYYFI